MATRRSDNPIEPEVMEQDIWDGVYGGTSLPMVLELPSAYHDEDDD